MSRQLITKTDSNSAANLLLYVINLPHSPCMNKKTDFRATKWILRCGIQEQLLRTLTGFHEGFILENRIGSNSSKHLEVNSNDVGQNSSETNSFCC